MFAILVTLDFSEDISIKKLLDLPYKVEGADEEVALT